MKINFDQQMKMTDGEIEVTVHAANLSPEVLKLMQQIDHWTANSVALPVNVDDRIRMVPFDDIIMIEVFGAELTIHTIGETYKVRGQLNKILEKLPADFIQVGKGGAININHLNSMEAAFSGSMTAFLTNNIKIGVSRKFLPELKRQLGI